MTTNQLMSAPSTEIRRRHSVDDLTPYLPLGITVLLALAVAGNAVDILLAKAALDVVLNETEFISALVAVAIAIVAMGTAAGGGFALRKGRTVIGSLLMLAWLFIGLALATMRWNLGILHEENNELSDRILAILMLAVFVAAGIEIAMHGGALLDRAAAFRAAAARRKIAIIDRRRDRVAAQYTRIDSALARIPDHRDRSARQYKTALERIDRVEDELMAYSRDLLAEALANPAHTGVIRQPQVKD